MGTPAKAQMTDETQATVETDGNDTAAVLAAASGDKTYLSEPATAEPDGEAEAPLDDIGDDAPAAADEALAEAPKAKRSAQDRIDEITAQKHEAAREAEFWKAKALGTANAQPAQVAQDTPQGDGRPDRADYENDFDYIEDLTDWKAEQAADRRFREQAQHDQARTTLQTFETRTKTLYPTGEPAGLKAFREHETLPVVMMEIVGTSDIGPKLAEHLGDNPAEIARMWGLSPVQQARELTLIESRLTIPSKPIPKTATDAPEPPPQARGAGGHFKVAADTDDFAAFEKQYRIGG